MLPLSLTLPNLSLVLLLLLAADFLSSCVLAYWPFHLKQDRSYGLQSFSISHSGSTALTDAASRYLPSIHTARIYATKTKTQPLELVLASHSLKALQSIRAYNDDSTTIDTPIRSSNANDTSDVRPTVYPPPEIGPGTTTSSTAFEAANKYLLSRSSAPRRSAEWSQFTPNAFRQNSRVFRRRRDCCDIPARGAVGSKKPTKLAT